MIQRNYAAIRETNVTIMVKDIDRSIDFYKKFGLKIKNRWDNYYATLSNNGLTIGLHAAKNATGNGSERIGLKTSNIVHAKAFLKKSKINFEPDQTGSNIHFKDPDGTSLFLMQVG